MNDSLHSRCHTAVEQCIAHFGLSDDDTNPVKRGVWLKAQRITAGRSPGPLREGYQHDVEAALGDSDLLGGWTALATVLLNCWETVSTADKV